MLLSSFSSLPGLLALTAYGCYRGYRKCKEINKNINDKIRMLESNPLPSKTIDQPISDKKERNEFLKSYNLKQDLKGRLIRLPKSKIILPKLISRKSGKGRV